MSAQVEAVAALCGLAVAAAAVVLPALPAASRRVKAMQVDRERRQGKAREVVDSSSTSRFEQELSAHSVPAQPNYHRPDEYPTVELPADEAQVWAVQERLPKHAEVEEPVEVVLVTPDLLHWLRAVAVDDEPTPLAPGPVPQLPEDIDPNTVGWSRAEIWERIRRAEYELAKGEQAA